MAICTGFIQPLDLECLLVNTFSGSIIIFTALSFTIISALAARFRMPNTIFLVMVGLFGVLMSRFIEQGIYLLIIIIAGLVSFYSIPKIVKN